MSNVVSIKDGVAKVKKGNFMVRADEESSARHVVEFMSPLDGVNIQGTYRKDSGNVQGTFREHSGHIEWTFRELTHR